MILGLNNALVEFSNSESNIFNKKLLFHRVQLRHLLTYLMQNLFNEPGYLSSLQFRVGKNVPPSDDVPSEQLGIQHLLPGSKVINSRLKNGKKSEGSWDISKMPVIHAKFLELSALEVWWWVPRVSAIVFHSFVNLCRSASYRLLFLLWLKFHSQI